MADPSDGASGNERRAFERVSARIEVKFQDVDQAARALRAYSLNVSAGGLCLRTQRRYDVGTQLSLEMSVGGEDFKLTGVVMWVRGDAVGVRFLNVSDDDRDRLARITAALAKS